MRPLLILFSIAIFVLISLCNDRFFVYFFVWFSGFFVAYLNKNNKIANSVVAIAALYFSVQAFIGGCKFINTHLGIEFYKVNFGVLFSLLIYLLFVVLDLKFCVLRFTSKFAYSLYILHFPIILFFVGCFERLVINDPAMSFVIGVFSMIVCVIVSYLSSKIFENKMLLDRVLSQSIKIQKLMPLVGRESKRFRKT